jgi:kynurenine formamidase
MKIETGKTAFGNYALNDLCSSLLTVSEANTFMVLTYTRRASMSLTLAALLLQAPICTAEELRYEHANEFGADDSLGAANYLTPEKALAASKLVRLGRSYALGMVSSTEVPAWGERKFGVEAIGIPLSPDSTVISAHDDRWVTHVGIGTQIDGLGHLGIDGIFYNGRQSKDFFREDGLTALGTEEIPPIVSRGVLLDIASHRGKQRLAASEAIDVQTLQQAAKRQGVTIGRGDVVLLHTGWMSMMGEDPEAFMAKQPGIDLGAARYLAELGVVAVGSDTAALEVQPSSVSNHPYPVHGLFLANYGVYILENIVTHELAADKAYEFMFVLGQPRLKGSVQAIISPVAIR